MYKLENNVEWTEELKNTFKHGIIKSKLLFDDFEVNESNNLIDVKLTENRYVPEMGFIGQAVARQIEANLTFDLDKQEILENKEFDFKLGAVYNDTTYYINYGKFLILDAPENDKTSGKTKIVAYDYMVKFNKEYQDRVAYPCTLKELLLDICNQAGVECATKHFVNEDFMVENNQFEGESLRTVLQNIAKCAFTWARIGQDNKLYLDFTINPEHTEILTTDDYKLDGFTIADNLFGPVNQVTYADTSIEGQEERVRDEESISKIGTKELVVYNNLFAYTPEKAMELIREGTVLFTLNYMPTQKLETIGFIYIDCNDELQVISPTGETYKTLALNHEIQYTGTTKDTFGNESDTSNEQAYKNTATSIYQNMQTKITVDKANKKIQQLIVNEQDTNKRLVELSLTVDGIASKVEDINDLTKTIKGVNKLTLEKCIKGYIIGLRIYGNNSVFKYLFPEDDLFPDDRLYPMGDSRIIVTDKDGNKQRYELGVKDVLRANDEVRDEYVLEDGYAKVIRRVNKDGSTKPEPLIEDIGIYTIYVEQGINTIEIENYTASIEIRYVPENSFTKQFATQIDLTSSIEQTQKNITLSVGETLKQNYYTKDETYTKQETKSEIKLTSDSIDLKLEKKVDDETLTGANIALRINEDSSSQAIINADSININGVISANQNFKIDTQGNMECNKAVCTGIDIRSGGINMNIDENTDANQIKISANKHYSRMYITGRNLAYFKTGSPFAQIDIGVMSDSDEGYIDCSGDISAVGDMYCTYIYADNLASDVRLKNNIKESKINALDKIKQMEHIEFDFKDNGEHHNIGYKAQQMEQIDSNYVNYDAKNDKYYMNLLPILATVTKAVQEQQEIIEKMQQEIIKLKEERNNG